MTTRQPNGTVTFLLTDIEGSTLLVAELGEAQYSTALTDHCDLLRAAFVRHDGYEVDYEGDAFVVAFQDTHEALAAADEAQRALSAHPWPGGSPIRVRMGLHTGKPLVVPPKYVGIDVHIAARVMAAGHGGQVLVSAATAALSDRADLYDLGEHRLKDIEEPISIVQLGGQAFPPLRTISNTNLPRPSSSFIGREHELSEVVAAFESGARLVTVTGPGGSGKTRLAREAAAGLLPAHTAGVFWVGLSGVRQAALVMETAAQVLGAKNGLAKHIGDRELMIVLDNFEQVIDAAREVSELISVCPRLRVLVTSRERLRVQGEVEYALPPLAEPEAVALFRERASAEPSPDIALLCTRLDNLPLAVELAAARASILSPRQILDRVSGRLDLLRGGRDADPRQQTLRATIEWSYDLLSDDEQRLFRSLSVFVGGCTLEAAEAACDADLDTLQALVEKNLLRYSNDRYFMLVTIKELAAELATPERPALARRHAEWYVSLAEGAAGELTGVEQGHWLEALQLDHDNLRAALSWSHENDVTLALRLTASLRTFWYKRGHIAEARRWFERAVEVGAGQPSVLRAPILLGGCVFAGTQNDETRARELAEEALALYRELGDRRGSALALRELGAVAARSGDYALASTYDEESAAIFGELGDRRLYAQELANLGDLAFRQGDFARARELVGESLELQRERGAKFEIAIALNLLGFVELCEERQEQARAALVEGMLLSYDLGSTADLAYSFAGLAAVAAARTEWSRAVRLAGRAEAILTELGLELEEGELIVHERTLAALRSACAEDLLAEGLAAGRSASDDATIALALELEDTGPLVRPRVIQ